MNTNSNVYTVIYTTVIVIVVAALLAFVSGKLGPAQDANAKAETLRQMMSAAGVKPTEELYAAKNAEILQLYADNIEEAYTIGLDGEKNGELSVSKDTSSTTRAKLPAWVPRSRTKPGSARSSSARPSSGEIPPPSGSKRMPKQAEPPTQLTP